MDRKPLMNHNNPRLYHINVTRRCNLSCSHCYIDPDIRDKNDILSPDQFSEIMIAVRDLYQEERRLPDIHIIGGEPTLVPIENHHAYLDAVSKHLDDIPHTLSLVSAIPNRRAVDIGKLYPQVITSWDADARQQNHWLWLGYINSLREAGVDVRIAVTQSRTVLDYGVERILDFLSHDAGFKKIHLAPLIPTPNAKEEMPLNGEISDALIRSAKWAMVHPEIMLTPYAGLLSAKDSEYDELACPVLQDAVNIEPDLNICSCVGKAGMSGELISYTGNLVAMIRSKVFQQEKVRHVRLPAHCIQCRHQQLCLGGCKLAHDYQPFDESGECHGFSWFLDYMANLEPGLDQSVAS